jgi:hypothetical protein
MNNKIEKYINGNYKITDEQLIAKDKLINIKNQLIEQIGGNETLNEINNLIGNINDLSYDTTNIINLIIEKAKKHNIDIKDLIKADKEMTKQYKEFNILFKNDKTFENHEELKNQLLNIYKGLFLLQVKIIFSKINDIIIKNPELIPEKKAIIGNVKTMAGKIEEKIKQQPPPMKINTFSSKPTKPLPKDPFKKYIT